MLKNYLFCLVIISTLMLSGCFIDGKVVDKNGLGIAGVKVTLNGNVYRTTTTDSKGYYQFGDSDNNLSAGRYTVTPSKSGYSFTPGSKNVTLATRTLDDFGNFVWPVFDVDFMASGGSIRGKTELLKGRWHFYYTHSNTTYHRYYTLNDIPGDKNDQGGYFITGTNAYGDFVAACYFPDDGVWTLLEKSISYDRFYVFYTNGSTILSNSCYYQYSSTGNHSKCFTLRGSKAGLKSADAPQKTADPYTIPPDDMEFQDLNEDEILTPEEETSTDIDESVMEKFDGLREILDSLE